MRRELVIDEYLKPNEELRFCAVVLKFKPKSAEIFNYRRWILFHVLKDFSSNDVVQNELTVGLTAANDYPSNYNAWNHCFCVIQRSLDHGNFALIAQQWEITKVWCCEHVSDHSCMQYRQRLLKYLVTDKRCIQHLKSCASKLLLRFFNSDERHKLMRPSEDYIGETIGVILDELYFNEDLIAMYQNHESLWNHRRFLCYLLVNIYSTDCIKEVLMNNEKRVCTNFLKGNEMFVKKYVLWLQTKLCISIQLL
ncbi:Hypothetical protein CINCED_3A000422 [Cinara cedri]|nr:Hypothetical protein CINCED_3A000422 [Cinara cedri]